MSETTDNTTTAAPTGAPGAGARTPAEAALLARVPTGLFINGEWVSASAGRTLDGVTHDAMPATLTSEPSP